MWERATLLKWTEQCKDLVNNWKKKKRRPEWSRKHCKYIYLSSKLKIRFKQRDKCFKEE